MFCRRRKKASKAAKKVADMLMDYGFSVDETEFSVVRGGESHAKQDCVERWSICVDKKDPETFKREEFEISSSFTLTECAKHGFWLTPNSRNSELYGDYEAVCKCITKPENALPEPEEPK